MTRKRKAATGGRGRWLGAGAGIAVAILAVVLADRPAPRPPRVAVPVAFSRPAPPPPLPAARVDQMAPTPTPAPAETRPRIAIVIDDLGLDRARTERAIALPAAITLSFMADAVAAPDDALAARRAGHEVLVHVPMEAMGHEDIGAHGLATGLPRAELVRRLDWDLDRFAGAVGLNNHMGSRLTADQPAMDAVLEDVKARGLLFLDSRTTAQTVAAATAQRLGVKFAERDVFLDDDQSPAAIQTQLASLEAAAAKLGTAVAIGHPHDATLAALTAWSAASARRFALVPLSVVVAARGNALYHLAPARAASNR